MFADAPASNSSLLVAGKLQLTMGTYCGLYTCSPRDSGAGITALTPPTPVRPNGQLQLFCSDNENTILCFAAACHVKRRLWSSKYSLLWETRLESGE